MADNKLPLDDHVLRYAGSNRLHRDENGNVIALAPIAFELRDIDEGLLSVTWVEYFNRMEGCPTDNAVKAYRKSMEKPLGKKSAFGKAKVDAIIKAGQAHEVSTTLRVLHEPTDLNPGHAAIHRYRVDDFELMELLATAAFTEIVLNRDVPE
jgi:hypothetical protein